jgi:hypothetical protein
MQLYVKNEMPAPAPRGRPARGSAEISVHPACHRRA